MSDTTAPAETREDIETTPDLPPGDHPLEMAARRGFGPLSPRAEEVWHGYAAPCVTCGEIVVRGSEACEHCGQDLTPAMLEKMRAHAGPWYVLEHVRPFPGVSLDRLIRQIHRRVLTETSIVRGPATDYQWRFAVETPGLCRLFHKCWFCHAEISSSDLHCPLCSSHLTFDRSLTPPPVAQTSAPAPGAAQAPFPPPSFPIPAFRPVAAGPDSLELERLRVALAAMPTPSGERPSQPVRRSLPSTWIAVGVLALIAIVLIWAGRVRPAAIRVNEPAPVNLMPKPGSTPSP